VAVMKTIFVLIRRARIEANRQDGEKID
jgi:hypothetical protein